MGFPGARLIGRLKRRVRRNGKKSTEQVYLISSLSAEQLDAAGWIKLKRGYWVIESRLHHALMCHWMKIAAGCATPMRRWY